MAFGKERLLKLYRKRARRYDLTSRLYGLLGFRIGSCRERAVAALGLEPGDTVVEIGCGTGLNFSLLRTAVGAEGRIVGVDMTDAMLERARRRISDEGWRNVALVHSDAASYEFPQGVAGILSTFALTLVPEFDRVVQRGARALRAGGRWVLVDFKLPETAWEKALLPLLLPLSRPFGVTLDLAQRHPWESLACHLDRFEMEEHYLGFVYVAWGEVDPDRRSGERLGRRGRER